MFYDLSKPESRQKFLERIDKLINQKAYVELIKKNQRSNDQNRYLHLLFKWFSLETGYSEEYVKQRFFKKEANPEIFIRETSGKLGTVRALRSTADLTTTEMTTAIERFRNWSSIVAGVDLPDANEHEFLKHIEQQASQNFY